MLVTNPSTSEHKVGEKKNRVKFPCRLCEGSHQTHLFPRMDEASKLLEDITVFQQQLPTDYCNFSPNLPLVDQAVDLIPSSVDPTLPLKSEVKLVDPIPSLVDPTLPFKSQVQVVDMTPLSVYPALPLKSEVGTANIFFSLQMTTDKGEFSLFQWNPLQVIRLFPLIGAD
jgi:hypothetical protein